MNVQTLHLSDIRDYVKFYQQSNGNVEITDIVVGTERRKGLGTRLIEVLKDKCRRMPTRCVLIIAVTRVSNVRAQQFYEALGFRIVGRLHDFYHNDYHDKPTDFESALMYGYDL